MNFAVAELLEEKDIVSDKVDENMMVRSYSKKTRQRCDN